VGDRVVVADANEREWLDLHVQCNFQALMSTPALALYQTRGNLPVLEYTRIADRGDIDGAREASARLDPHRKVFQKWMRGPWVDHGVLPIASLKAWLGLVGLPQGPVGPGSWRSHPSRSASCSATSTRSGSSDERLGA
jgi:4-hydroxy-tetrahydrodipicolinate synthase